MERDEQQHQDLITRVLAHADDFKGEVLPSPLMLRHNIFKVLGTNHESLASVYDPEADSFEKLACRLAPPDILADHSRLACNVETFTVDVPKKVIDDAFKVLAYRTSEKDQGKSDVERGHQQFFFYTQDEMRNYTEFCVRDPDLLLGMVYSVVVNQAYMMGLIGMSNPTPEQTKVMMAFREHLNATNYLNNVPFAMRIAQVRKQGVDAGVADMNASTMEDAMKFLHATEQFSISTPSGEIRCPMAGYLQKFFVQNDGLMPIIQAAHRLTNDSQNKSFSQHMHNRANVQEVAESYL